MEQMLLGGKPNDEPVTQKSLPTSMLDHDSEYDSEEFFDAVDDLLDVKVAKQDDKEERKEFISRDDAELFEETKNGFELDLPPAQKDQKEGDTHILPFFDND